MLHNLTGHPITYRLGIGCRMEAFSKSKAVAQAVMANARKGLGEVQVCRGHGADDKVAACVRVSIEREASGFIGKKGSGPYDRRQ